MASDYDELLPGTSGEKLSDQIWYHGLITRIHSETILKKDGEFLVRDSISKAGDYVLTARWKAKALHFQINSTIEKCKKMYHFEEEYFFSVTNLINFYMTHKRPITLASGCQISDPVSRQSTSDSDPKSKELEASYMQIFRPGAASLPQRSLSQQAIINQATLRQTSTLSDSITTRPLHQRPLSTMSTPISVPPLSSALIRRPLPVPIRTSVEEPDDYCDIDYDAMEDVLDASHNPLNERAGSVQSLPSAYLSRQFQSCTSLRAASPVLYQKNFVTTPNRRPPLPPRPTELERCNSSSALRATSTEENSYPDLDYDDPKPLCKAEEDYNTLTKASNGKCTRLSGCSDYDILSAENSLNIPRQRDSGVYGSPSPPNEVVTVYSQLQLNQLRMYLLSKKPAEIAEAITYDDVKLLRFLGFSERSGVGTDNGLRQLLLPTGSSLRAEMISRARQLQLAIVLSIVTASRLDAPRLLRQWILTASCLLSKQQNLFGFANIVIALEAKFMQSILWLWSTLDRQSHTEWEECRQEYRARRTSTTGHDTPSTASIPFLQPVLQILGGAEVVFLDGLSFCADIESFWRWLDGARTWMSESDNIRAILRGRLINSRCGVENPISNIQLQRLFLGSGMLLDEDRYSLICDCLQKFAFDAM